MSPEKVCLSCREAPKSLALKTGALPLPTFAARAVQVSRLPFELLYASSASALRPRRFKISIPQHTRSQDRALEFCNVQSDFSNLQSDFCDPSRSLCVLRVQFLLFCSLECPAKRDESRLLESKPKFHDPATC